MAGAFKRVVVIGGGLVGASVAYYLSIFGMKVTLVEQRNLASGASGRNGGMIMKIDGRDNNPAEILKRLVYVNENDRLLDGLSREFDDDFGVRRRGSLDIATTDGEVGLLRNLVKMQKEDTGDEEIRFLEAAELRRLSPFLSPVCLAARLRPSDGCLFPFRLVHTLCASAAERGVQVKTWTKVEEILIDKSGVGGVRTSDGIIESDCVVVAANGWTKTLLPDFPVMPLRSLAVLTEPVPPIPVLTFEAELKGKIIYGCTQTERGGILVGGPPDRPAPREGQFNEDVTFQEMKINSSILPDIFPPLKKLHLIRAWAGTMGITPDGLPCVGRVGGCNGLYAAAGYSNGMSWGLVTGKLLAELIAAGGSSISLDTLDPGRFAGRELSWPPEYDYTVLAEFLGRTG